MHTLERAEILAASPRPVRCCGDHQPMAMRDGSRRSEKAAAPTMEELGGRALRRLLRGGTWEALANEIAWEAVRSTGCDLSCLGWLPGLVEAWLSEQVDGLEFVLERVRVAAVEGHLRVWPNDLAGAKTAGTLAADDEAERRVSRLYLDVLERAGSSTRRSSQRGAEVGSAASSAAAPRSTAKRSRGSRAGRGWADTRAAAVRLARPGK